jgi:hypothetical protein
VPQDVAQVRLQELEPEQVEQLEPVPQLGQPDGGAAHLRA